jgi:recombination protein RecA
MSETLKAIDDVLSNIDAKVRKGFMIGSEITVERLTTPSFGLTQALGGGWGMGRQVLVWGPRSAGKTTLALAQIAMAQKEGKSCAYFDVERTFDPTWATQLGVDTDNLIVISNGTINAMVNEGNMLIKAGLDVMVVDSISALMPPAYVEKDGELKDFENTGRLGALAAGLSSALPMLNYANTARRPGTLLFLISQSRMAQKGSMYWGAAPTGGKAVEFYSSQIVQLFSSESQDNTVTGDVLRGGQILRKPIGRKVSYTVTKNKLGPEGGSGDYHIYYDGDFLGMDSLGELFDYAVATGIIKKAGAWYSHGGEQIGQGRDRSLAAVRASEELTKSIVGELNGRG